MNKNNNSKKNNVDQLYKILDSDSKKELPHEDKNYLKSLSIRLKSSDKEIKIKPKIVKKSKEKDVDFLKPKVDIHIREKKKIDISEYIKEKPKEKPYEKDLLEIEKVEIVEPKFIGVKPKVITKQKIEKLPEMELIEWEEVNIKNIEQEKIKEEISEEVTTEPVEFIEKIEEIKEKEKIETTPTFEKLDEFTEKTILDFTKKIETFKDYKAINEKTAILLYDNGYTSADSLKNATIKDLRKIKGIKRRTTKKIKKEIDKKIEEEIQEKYKDITETIEEEIKEEKPVEFKKIEEEQPIPIEPEIKYTEWEAIEDKELEKKEITVKVEESIEERNKKIETFKDYKTINEKTAILLYDNGYTSDDSLKNATIKDLRKIKGIKRRTAKKIKKEIDKKIEEEKPVIYEKEKEQEPSFEKEYKKKVLKDKKTIKKYEKEEVFRDIKIIDEKIAKLLIENGINSIDALRKMTIKDLTSIRGIKRKIAKKIKNEINKISEKTEKHLTPEFYKPKKYLIKEDKLEIFDEKKVSKPAKKEIKGFKHKEYILYEKKIKTKTGKKIIIRFFSKAKPKDSKPIEIPKGFNIIVNKKTGVPYLKKKK